MVSKHYDNFVRNLKHAKKIVRAVNIHECTTDLQHLKLQSYILLTHAIFEEYVEDLCSHVALEARTVFAREGRITKALVALIAAQVLEARAGGKGSRKIGSELVRNLDEFSKQAYNSFIDVIKNNNGIKPDNLRTLFLPIGVDPFEVDTALVNAMDAFGTKRGGIAHKFAIRRENTLGDIQNDVDNIGRDIESLDKAAYGTLSVALSNIDA